MKKTLILLTTLLLFSQIKAQNEENRMDTISYSLGVLVAQNLKQQGLGEVKPEQVAKGIDDVLKGNTLRINVQEANANLQKFMQEKQKDIYAQKIAEGEKFLAENGKRKGVTTLPSGLQYEVINQGVGNSPTTSDNVTVHYHGTLIDGTVFDSSVNRGEPATFGVTQVIKGWTEVLQLMKIGDKWRVYLPYDLAYGDRGAGEQITPFSTLIFEIELLKIN